MTTSPNPARIRATADRSASTMKDIATVLPERLAAILDRMAGQPGAAGSDGVRVSSSEIGDPTGKAAIKADRARENLQLLARSLGQVDQLLDGIVRLLAAYQPREASSIERAATDRKNMPTCASCARLRTRGRARQEPAADEARNPGGVLSEAMRLCDWCDGFVGQVGHLPSVAQLERHHTGGKVMVDAP